MPPKKGFAFFDLDHTLLPHDTQTLFCNYVLRRERWRTLLHLAFVPFALARVVGLTTTLRAKRAFLGYLWRMPMARLKTYARDFSQHCVLAWAYPELMDEMERHRAEGRVLVMNTASPTLYSHEIAEAFGFDYCVSTKVRLTDPLSFHPLIAVNNKREEKIEAMMAEVPGVAALTEEERNDHCYTYTDSPSDLPLLEIGRNGVLVHPSPSFATLGIRNEWTLLHPRRPYSGAVGNLLAAIRQVLGLYPEQPQR